MTSATASGPSTWELDLLKEENERLKKAVALVRRVASDPLRYQRLTVIEFSDLVEKLIDRALAT